MPDHANVEAMLQQLFWYMITTDTLCCVRVVTYVARHKYRLVVVMVLVLYSTTANR